jgi:hypothetical protein
VLALVIVAALAALIVAGLSACGGAGVAGTYAFDSGSEKQMAEFKLTLNDDDTFTLAGPNPLGGEEEVTINGTYTLDGDSISLKDSEGTESEVGTVDGDKLVFQDVTWVKE